MATIFTTAWNYREQEPQAQEFTEKSQTQPDEVLSIREMLERHVRGLPVRGASSQGHYYDESIGYVPSMEELDLSEIGDLRDRYRETVERLQQQEREAKASAKVQKPAEGGKPQKSDGQLESSEGDVESSGEA